MNPGLPAAALAYLLWGLFPLYFRRLHEVNPFEIALHRSLWCLVFMLGVLTVRRHWTWLAELLAQPRRLGLGLLSALLLSFNWVLYVWAVNNDRVLESSLGYFINPLFNVALGMVVLRERPQRLQLWALLLAAIGVVWLGWQAGAPPWIALSLAGSFSLYGLLKKTAPLGALEGLTLETLLLLPLVLPALAWISLNGHSSLQNASPSTWTWLVLAGPITAVPLLLFAYGAQRIRLGTLGLLQYLGPSLQFALGVWVFHEPMQPERLLGFALIWLALLLYSAATLWHFNTATPAAPNKP